MFHFSQTDMYVTCLPLWKALMIFPHPVKTRLASTARQDMSSGWLLPINKDKICHLGGCYLKI
jgi:hypothetical protein